MASGYQTQGTESNDGISSERGKAEIVSYANGTKAPRLLVMWGQETLSILCRSELQQSRHLPFGCVITIGEQT